jgi:type II secretory pathway pseudopilin PulG
VTHSSSRSHGFSYLGVLFAIAIMGAWLAAVGQVWHTVNQRDKESQMLWNGNEIRKAIGSYYERTPGNLKRYPLRLEDLLKDNRFLVAQRHLRTIYPDPMTPSGNWEMLKLPSGEIYGVASKSIDAPLKKENFPTEYKEFTGKEHYSQWVFISRPSARTMIIPSGPPPGLAPPPGTGTTPSTGTLTPGTVPTPPPGTAGKR